MAIDDLPLHRPGPPSHPRDRPSATSPTRWVVAGALAVAVAASLTLWWMSRARPQPGVPPPTRATDVAVGSNRPKRQPMTLPNLDASDTLLSELVASLSHHPLLARLMATRGVVRSAVLAVEQIGDGRTPEVPLKVLRPTDRLAITGGESGRVDPRTYARWDAATSALTSINPPDAAQLYVNVKPLFDEASREMGHPDGDFDASIIRAIQTLQETPVPVGDPELIRRPGYYEHTDAALRGLPPVQKQLLLIGPDNRQKVMGWLKRLATALDLKI